MFLFIHPMQKKLFFLFSVALLMSSILLAQEPWKRFFHSPVYESFSYQVIENYDGGYLLGGVLKRQDGLWPGWVVKTDINGMLQWQKIISGEKESPSWSISKTDDNGFIIGGRFYNGQKYDAYVMKLNACAEPEWCSFLAEEDGESSEIYPAIHQLPDGSYICERLKRVFDQHHRWSLIKLRANGTIDWVNYFDLNTSYWAQIDVDMKLTTDTCFLVTSSVYDTIRPDGALSEMPLWYKVDNDGNLLWETKWELSEPQTPAQPRVSVEDVNGNYYSGGYISPWKTSHIYKLGHNGDTLSRFRFYDPIQAYSGGQINTLSYLNDTTILVGTQFWDTPEGNHWAFSLSDTLGAIKKRIFEKEQIQFGMSLITSDNKILAIGVTDSQYPGHPSMVGLYKFNSNLEYDSIYTAPRTYDSLCPYPIVSDTIPMPGICTFVSLPEPINKSDVLQLKVYPNPASEYVTIEIPEYSVTTTKGGYVTQQQFRPLTGEVQLSVINLSGQIVKTEVFDASERNHVIKVNMLTPGLYMLHLTQKGKFVAQGKVMVVR
jgi:hypothetical protein